MSMRNGVIGVLGLALWVASVTVGMGALAQGASAVECTGTGKACTPAKTQLPTGHEAGHNTCTGTVWEVAVAGSCSTLANNDVPHCCKGASKIQISKFSCTAGSDGKCVHSTNPTSTADVDVCNCTTI